ncbi:outer membrane protein [Salinisphaera sp. T5B8]|uniref:TolC family protein n=1 Tax=Salinisphaera sp. T5B8 TaxID=1304154 RepID=UPI0033421B35
MNAMTARKAVAACLVIATGATAWAGPPAAPPPPAAASTSTPATAALSLRDAVDRAMAANVQTLLADARRDEVAGDRREARAAFLPHVSANVSQARRQNNLAAQGLDIQSALDSLGPAAQNADISVPDVVTYNSFDARAELRQNLFDYSAWQQYKSAKLGERVAADQLALAREQVASQAALDYVGALAARASVDAARADLELADRLADLAVDQENVGIATGVDVTRAQTRQARARARLAQARTNRTRADIRLARTVGMPLDTPLALSDDLHYSAVVDGDIETDLDSAYASRAELRLAQGQLAVRRAQLAGARGARLPSLSASATYGESGNTYHENVEDTYTIGAQIEVPIFDGGAISARIDSAASRLDQQRIRYRDTRTQIEQDVRVARRTLHTLADQVRAAESAFELASRELGLSRDRFAEGISDNVEVIDAQAALADARNGRVAALADYTRARINLAAALGRASRFRLYEPATP